MNKKIAFIIGGLRGGGAEKVCITLANGLAGRGYEIDLVVLSLNGAIRDKELSPEVNLVNLGIDHARYSALALWQYLQSAKPQTVLSFNRQISVVLGLVRKLTRLNFRLVSRNIIFLSIAESNKKGLWHGFISKHLIRWFYALSDLLIAQSHAMKEDMVSYLRLPESRFEVIHNPVCQKVAEFSTANDLGTVEKRDYLLCVGRLEPQKAFHYAISAFSAIAPAHPKLRLKIVGKGSLEGQLKEQARMLGVADRVDFEGYQADMIPHYLHAKATLLTSLYEGFPNVLVESIALGTPVVAFDCPSGPGEIVMEEVNGFLVRHEDQAHLKECINLALPHPWNKGHIVETSKRFSAAKILDLYSQHLLGMEQ
jgi:glycosyltransferase involved in cell wall biosynthesis